MRIGIIGSGNIGATLTRRLTALGHDVAVSNSRGPQSLEALAGETGATAAEPATAADSATGARSEERTDAYLPDMIAVESPKPPSAHRSDELAPPRRLTRRGIGRDEPFRKK